MKKILTSVFVFCAFLCLTAKGSDKQERILADFEDAAILPQLGLSQGKGELSDQHATSGKKSLKIESGTVMIWQKAAQLPSDWSGYDSFEMDVYNDTGKPAAVYLELLDQPGGTTYWNRHIANFSLPPGQSVFRFSIKGLYRGEAGSRYNLLKTDIDVSQLIRLLMRFGAKGDGFLYLDKMRLARVALPEGIYAFDFGQESQPLEPGFKAVSWNSLYDKSTGYGLRRMCGEKNRARDDTFPTDLYRDFVELCSDGEANEFVVDLPNGNYHVWVVYDDCGYWAGEAVRSTKRHIEAEGKVVWSEDRGERGDYWEPDHHFENVEPLPGSDFWKLYMEYLFQPKEFEVTVSDGQLSLRFFADKPWSSKVAAVIIYPDSIKEHGVKFVRDVVEAQRSSFLANCAEISTPAGGTLDAIPPERKAKGYLFFLTDYEQNTYLTTIPRPEQLPSEKRISACLGEYEPVTFAIRPLKDMGEAKVAVSGFTGSAGVIPANAWDVRVARHLGIRKGDGRSYEIVPRLLRRFETVELPANLTREFWATVHVPEDTASGDYIGAITITASGGLKEVLKVRLTVLPFKLDESEYVFGFLSISSRDMDEQVGRLLIAHGMNSLSGGPYTKVTGWDDNKQPVIDFSAVDKYMAVLKQCGFSREILGYGGPGVGLNAKEWEEKTGLSAEEITRRVYAKAKEHAATAGWLPFIMNFCDEPRNPDHGKKIVNNIKSFKNATTWPKIIGLYSVSFKKGYDPDNYVHQIFDALDASGLNNHDESVMERAAKLGKEIYIYNQGQSRYSFGVYQWSEYQKGVKGRWQWILHIQHGFQYFDLDGREPDPGVIYYGVDGPIPTPELERCREGADDFYYCQTLANLIKKKSGSSLAGEAEAWLKSITDRIRINERKKPDWLDQDKTRVTAADYIMKLLGKNASAGGLKGK